MWREFLEALGWRKKPPPIPPPRETVESLIARLSDLRELLEGLGYNRSLVAESAGLVKELVSLVRAEIVDYAALRTAIAAALVRREDLPERVSAFLRTLAVADTAEATLAVLNSDPVHDHVPFVEQIPVVKNGAVTWQAPLRHSLIRKYAVEAPRFREVLGELERLFAAAHPARSEAARAAVVEAIERVRRELDREQGYLPAPLEALEARVAEYHAGSLKPKAAQLLESLLALLGDLADAKNTLAASEACDARPVAALAARYLENARLRTRGVTSYLLILLMDEKLVARTRPVTQAELLAMDLIRAEIAGGCYDGPEMARRIRSAAGFYVSSLVYPLLDEKS